MGFQALHMQPDESERSLFEHAEVKTARDLIHLLKNNINYIALIQRLDPAGTIRPTLPLLLQHVVKELQLPLLVRPHISLRVKSLSVFKLTGLELPHPPPQLWFPCRPHAVLSHSRFRHWLPSLFICRLTPVIRGKTLMLDHTVPLLFPSCTISGNKRVVIFNSSVLMNHNEKLSFSNKALQMRNGRISPVIFFSPSCSPPSHKC